jgi:exopolyphosphatase/guanosine-5'-triphosphate,3'-diphosphate pyrophosphatase
VRKPGKEVLMPCIFFAGMLKKHHVKKVRAIGTAALRSAENGQEFIQEVEKLTGITINQISGDEEARLISEGVRLAFPMDEEPVLIMDVGGGSVEYIICNRDEIFWKQSFNIGISVLYNKFHKTEPISEVVFRGLCPNNVPSIEGVKRR